MLPPEKNPAMMRPGMTMIRSISSMTTQQAAQQKAVAQKQTTVAPVAKPPVTTPTPPVVRRPVVPVPSHGIASVTGLVTSNFLASGPSKSSSPSPISVSSALSLGVPRPISLGSPRQSVSNGPSPISMGGPRRLQSVSTILTTAKASNGSPSPVSMGSPAKTVVKAPTATLGSSKMPTGTVYKGSDGVWHIAGKSGNFSSKQAAQEYASNSYWMQTGWLSPSESPIAANTAGPNFSIRGQTFYLLPNPSGGFTVYTSSGQNLGTATSLKDAENSAFNSVTC